MVWYKQGKNFKYLLAKIENWVLIGGVKLQISQN